jgi:hypothetical protein
MCHDVEEKDEGDGGDGGELSARASTRAPRSFWKEQSDGLARMNA